MSLVLTSDFIGEYKIPKDCFDDLQGYILKYEKHYLIQLLGADLYDLFIADLDASTPQVPQSARFLAIYNEIKEDDNGFLNFSEGMRNMMVQFIYYHFVRNLQFVNTSSGTRMTESQSSTGPMYNGFNLVEAYNQGVCNYRAIQLYIRENIVDYPEENAQLLLSTSGI